MKTISATQIKALLRKDVLVRWRQPWMPIVQIIWPCLIFMLLYSIRLKYGPERIDDCQFPTRLLPTKNNVIPSFYSYICSIQNRCQNTSEYEEISNYENAPMKPIIDIVQIFVTDDRMFTALTELPEKANFISAVTTLVTGGHMDTIRKNVEKVVAMVPQVEKVLNGAFDIKKVFSNRATFVKTGYLLCGHPFPQTEVIPLVNDILYSEDFSEVNDDELKVMPTKYCKQLYLDITSSNHGKLTWSAIKPIIHGKILYTPDTEDTRKIIQFTNTTFAELNRLQQLSVAMADILTKLRVDEKFKSSFDDVIKLAQSPLIRSIIGDEIDMDQIESVIHRIRTDPIIYDVIVTIKNILECMSVDRFVPIENAKDIHMKAYELNHQRLFYAAVNFNETSANNVAYTFHMDTENTQPTFENHNRFWFPGPSKSMVRDLKYHRGFVQIKQALDVGIIKYKKEKLRELGLVTERPTTTTKSSLSVQVLQPGDDYDDENGFDNTDDWFTDEPVRNNASITSNGTAVNGTVEATTTISTTERSGGLLSSFFGGLNLDDAASPAAGESKTVVEVELDDPIEDDDEDELQQPAKTTTASPVPETDDSVLLDELSTTEIAGDFGEPTLKRTRRDGLFDMFSSFFGGESDEIRYDVDKLQFYTKQFPYPSYMEDDFKTGIYLAHAIQSAFFLGLVAQIASSVRHLIWMRESRNTTIMRSMGLKAGSEITAWTIICFAELFLIFVAITVILYTDGILIYTKWLFVMIFLMIFSAALIAFCFMCSTFFSSATIGAVATGVFFFITYCPYIIVLLFDAQLTSLQNFAINLSFTSAFSHAWSQIMRLELQEMPMTFAEVAREGFSGEFGFGVFMVLLDTCIYILVGYLNQRYKSDENRFVLVQRDDLDASVGATMTNVTKIYGDGKFAVSNVSLSFPRDQVTCLLGRNGAGKSTLIKMLTGQIVQSSGRVILSQAMSNCTDYDNVGVCSQDNILIPTLTAREHLELYAKIKVKHGYSEEVERTLKSLNFGKYEKYMASQLSGGYQRRLCVAIAFIGSPNVVILDEPCNGVDAKARKDIWDLIERLRKGRAVIFATHFLDEAEYLSDAIIIMKNGAIIAKHNPETLKNQCTTNYKTIMQCSNSQTTQEIIAQAQQLLTKYKVHDNIEMNLLSLEISYDQREHAAVEFLKYLEGLQRAGRIKELSIESENLEQFFVKLDHNQNGISNGHAVPIMQSVQLKKAVDMDKMVRDQPLTRFEAIRELFWKRFVHFSRNYRMLLCVIVLPALFEILAMWFVAYRLEDDFEKVISLDRNLYPKTTQVLSMEQRTPFTGEVYGNLKQECASDMTCREFSNSKDVFYWILETLPDYHYKRFGGYTFNETKSIVWYNNKGYHAMMAWMNDLNTHIMRTELNDTSFSITAYNEPWKLGLGELSHSSILRQAGDSCMVLILLIAYSLVVAVASVYLVNERMKGEKLQQKLCGVDAATYWGVAFVWDFLVITLAILVCTLIILAFGMPVFVDRQQLWGVIVISLFFGFACIPAVHVFEKFFTDSSVAIVTIYCMNVIIPLFTLAIIVLLGVIGDSAKWDEWRFFLNRLFLIFPQHALGDGLLEICKNYMVAQVFKRYDIDSYKNPINSNLLKPHLMALTVLGIFFAVLNVLIESGLLYRGQQYLRHRLNCWFMREAESFDELRIVSIQNSLKRNEKANREAALKVENLTKAYVSGQYAVKKISFAVERGECFGLLGKNGAGKSTIFKMLSGQLQADFGTIEYANREISYCPQTNTLDALLTVEECIKFYGRLRRINDIPKLVECILESYQLESYRKVLVKNLSGGNRRKLTVATTCLGHTAVVLMDEPTSDMDPLTRNLVYGAIDDLLQQQRAIVLTSHSIAEIENICHRIAVLKEGQILTCSSPESLKAQYGSYYNVAIFCDDEQLARIEQEIKQRFPQCNELQRYIHTLKFNLKIQPAQSADKLNENRVDVPAHMLQPAATAITLTLADLFAQLEALSRDNTAASLRYAVTRCRLDKVFEHILESSESNAPKRTQINGSAGTGYVHEGYVETETST